MDTIDFYMTRNLITIDSQASVTQASQLMVEKNISALLVEEKGEHVGIVTEVDFNRRVIARELNPAETKISAIMSHPIIGIEHNLSMNEALAHMNENHLRHILVTENAKIVGMLSVKDFVVYCVREYVQGQGQDNIDEFWEKVLQEL